ncbi:MAG: PadR family transcriptional regulator [Candidatus Bathyarchaeota archaeon]|nr:PadR family transcriptional regulator [Candidatus Termiticorpusculum sp.]
MTVQKSVDVKKEIQIKLAKKLLDVIILQFLSVKSMHGYEVITKIRKIFDVYFGPSTVYPLLATLEKKKYITSDWNMENDRPRKIYCLTEEGQNILAIAENSLNIICQRMSDSLLTDDDIVPADITESKTNGSD